MSIRPIILSGKKKLLRMRGIKSITYIDETIKNHPPVVFDFEKLKVHFTEREHNLVKRTKIYYRTMGGKLQSTETNGHYVTDKSDLEQLADTNPYYLLRRLSVTTGDPLKDGLMISDDGKTFHIFNNITLFCIYPQYSAIMSQSFWWVIFTYTQMTTTNWGELSKKDLIR